MRLEMGIASTASAPVSGAASAEAAKIRKCATEFEGILIAQMLRSAREAGGGGLTGDDNDDTEANSTLLELGEQQLAQALASSGALGIGKIVIAGLEKNAD